MERGHIYLYTDIQTLRLTEKEKKVCYIISVFRKCIGWGDSEGEGEDGSEDGGEVGGEYEGEYEDENEGECGGATAGAAGVGGGRAGEKLVI